MPYMVSLFALLRFFFSQSDKEINRIKINTTSSQDGSLLLMDCGRYKSIKVLDQEADRFVLHARCLYGDHSEVGAFSFWLLNVPITMFDTSKISISAGCHQVYSQRSPYHKVC